MGMNSGFKGLNVVFHPASENCPLPTVVNLGQWFWPWQWWWWAKANP